MASNNNNLLPNLSTHSTLNTNQYQKKRDSSHIPINHPSKRRKLNPKPFSQNFITNYNNYLKCLFQIIRMTIKHHNSVKQNFKPAGGGLINSNNLKLCQQTIIQAQNCDSSLQYNKLLNTIKKIIRHIPIQYQEKVAKQCNYKPIFDIYISKGEHNFQCPYILSTQNIYYKYIGGIPTKRSRKHKNKFEEQKSKTAVKQSLILVGSMKKELNNMEKKYSELLLKIRVQNKEIEQFKKDNIIQDAVIDGLNTCINVEKNSDNNNERNKDVTIITLKNVLKQLNEKHIKLAKEKDGLQKENIRLTEENFELKQRVNDLEYKPTILKNISTVIKTKPSIELNENNNNMEDIRIKKESNIGNNNDLIILDNNNNDDYCKDNDIDDIVVTNDNLNDGIIRILDDNININWCPKCGIKVTRTDKDIESKCSIMTCIQKGCGDGNNYTYWCWDCRKVINMNKLSFNEYTNEPAGACQNCREKSRIRRNKCKKINYAESVL